MPSPLKAWSGCQARRGYDRWLSGGRRPAEMGLPRKGDQRLFLEEEAAYKGSFGLKASEAGYLFLF